MKVVYLMLFLCASTQGLEAEGGQDTEVSGSSVRSTFKKVAPVFAHRKNAVDGERATKESRTMMRLNHFRNRIGRYGDELAGKTEQGDGEDSEGEEDSQPPGVLEELEESDDSTETDEGAPAEPSELAPSLVFTSPKSLVSAFLNFKSQINKEPKAKVMEVDKYGNKLKSNIKDYSQSQNEVEDLRKWTQGLAKEKSSNTRFDDYNYKQYGIVEDRTGQDKTTQIDMDEFIHYLVEHENFKEDDLGFLKLTDIDHGVEDIERELNKIRERENEASKSIVIGGEYESSASRLASIFGAYGVMTFYLLVI